MHRLPCGHVFHFHCLRSWIERSNTCPTCRAVIPSRQNPPVQPQNEPVVQQFDAPPLAPEHIEERANAPLEDARNPERRNDPYQNTEFQARRFHPQPGYPASFAQRFHHHGPTNSTLRRNSSLSTSSGNRMHTRPIQKDERIIKKSEKSQSTALLLQEQTLMTLQQIEFHQQALERLKNHYCTLLSLQEAAYHESQTAAFTSEASSSSQDPDPSQEIGNLESQDASATATSNSTSSSQDMGNPTGVINPTQTTEESQESRSSNDGIRRRVSSQQ